ncbi:hypothetical protein D3C84_263680 [compost metagenome]
MQEGAIGGRDALARPEEVVVPVDQLGRQQAIGNQLLWPVDVGQHRVEQARALGNTLGNRLPFLVGYQMRQQVQFPRTVGALGVGVDVVGHAVFLNLPGQQGLALGQLCRGAALQMREQALPMKPHGAIGLEHLVINPRRERVSVKQVRHGNARWQQMEIRLAQVKAPQVQGHR